MDRHGRLLIGWLTACVATGCAADDMTLIRAELRDREAAVREYRDQLQQVRLQLGAAQRENAALRAQLESTAARALLPEHTASIFSIEELAVQRLTGGTDTDGIPGDDALLVVLQPLDSEGDLRKAPGAITIELFDLALDGSGRRIGYWEFDAEQTRAAWNSGFFMSGYRFEIPWQNGYPRHDELNLHARFTTPDGRVFAKSHQFRVRMLPDISRATIATSDSKSSTPAAPSVSPTASKVQSAGTPPKIRTLFPSTDSDTGGNTR